MRTKGTDIKLRPDQHPAVLAAQTVEVSDVVTEEGAQELLLSARRELSDIEADRLEITEGMTSAKNAIQRQAAERSAPWKLVEDILNKALRAWWKKQEDKRAAENARIKALAEKEKAELEKKRDKAEASGKTTVAELFGSMVKSMVAPTLAPVDATVRTASGSVSKIKETTVEVTDPLAFVRGIVMLGFKGSVEDAMDAIRVESPTQEQRDDAIAGLKEVMGCLPSLDNEIKHVSTAPLFKVNPGPLKTAVKALGIKEFPGLRIEEITRSAVRAT